MPCTVVAPVDPAAQNADGRRRRRPDRERIGLRRPERVEVRIHRDAQRYAGEAGGPGLVHVEDVARARALREHVGQVVVGRTGGGAGVHGGRGRRLRELPHDFDVGKIKGVVVEDDPGRGEEPLCERCGDPSGQGLIEDLPARGRVDARGVDRERAWVDVGGQERRLGPPIGSE